MQFETLKIKDVKSRIGELVRLTRKKRSLSQHQLADNLNLSRVTIQKLESGKNTTIDTLLKVFQYFDLLEEFHQFISDEIQNNSYDSLY